MSSIEKELLGRRTGAVDEEWMVWRMLGVRGRCDPQCERKKGTDSESVGACQSEALVGIVTGRVSRGGGVESVIWRVRERRQRR